MTLRYAMIGGGPGAMIGEAHRLAARASVFTLAAGAFSSDPAKSRAQAEACGLAPEMGFADWPSLIAAAPDLKLDVVVIVTPNHLHAAPTIAALEAGLHVICDKPLTATLEEADAVAAAAKTSRGTVFVTYTYAGFQALRHAADIIASGGIGDVRLVQASFFQDWLATRVETSGLGMAAWRTDPSRSGTGGTIADLGTHVWQLIGMLTGMTPETISADLTSLVPGRTLDDTGLVRLRYANGARGQLAVSQAAVCSGGGLELQIMGSTGGIAWSLANPFELRLLKPGVVAETITLPDNGPYASIKGPPPGFLDAFAALYADFASAIRGDAVSPPSLSEGYGGMAFVNAAVTSSRHGGAWIET